MQKIRSGLSACAPLVLCALAASCGSSGGSPVEGEDAGSSKDAPLADETATSAGTRDGGRASSSSDAPLAGNTEGSTSAGTDASTSMSRPPSSINLGSAADYVILAETGISTVSPSTITGDLGVSPAAATYVTGFSLTLDASHHFSTSSQVSGRVYAADYASPTPSELTTAIDDSRTAFTAAAGRAPDVTGLGTGSIGGMTLTAGVYGWSTGLLIATDLTLSGTTTDVWIFQIAQGLTVSDGAAVVLSGGALPQNVYWQVSGAVSLGTTSQLEGIVLCQTGIALATGASITGGLFAQTAVTLDANTVVSSP